MTPREFIEIFVQPDERPMIWLDNFSPEQELVLQNILTRALMTARDSDDFVAGTISEIKYGGRLVILDDDSRWEVSEFDSTTVEMWSFLDRVVILDGQMFKLDELESVSVSPDR